MLKSLFIFILASHAVLFVTADDGKSDEPTECDEGVTQLLYNANAKFTGSFLYEAVKKNPNKNTIMSAFSVLEPMAQLALYSQGETLSQLLKVLNVPNKFNLRCVFPSLLSNLNSTDHVTLSMAARIFATDEHPLSKAFKDDLKLVFDSEAESLNFKNGQVAADRINEWVESKTNKRIKDIAKPDMFDQDTRLVLANAIYFLGNWAYPFEKYSTIDRPFYTKSDESSNIPTMYQQSFFKYAEDSNLDCKVLEMFYKGGKFSFVVFLPNKVDGLTGMLEKLKNHTAFYDAYHKTESTQVNVYLPKMKVEAEFDLIPFLQSAGIEHLFDKDKSNLRDILEEYEPLYVSVAKQKAFAAVDEKGTEAAAANVVVVAVPTSAIVYFGPTAEFKADHPFAFYIMNEKNIIFSGAFVKN